VPAKDKEYLISELGKTFLKTSAFRIGDFKTSRGKKTPYYIDLSRASSFPNVLSLVADCLELELNELSIKHAIDTICGVPVNGLVFGAVLASKVSKPLIHAPLEQDHRIIGMINPGANVLILNDVSETGKTIELAAAAVRANGGVVTDAITLIDRSEGAMGDLKKLKIDLHSVTTVGELAKRLKDNMALSEEQEEILNGLN
jgi:orotate phosphoribosyltransferase